MSPSTSGAAYDTSPGGPVYHGHYASDLEPSSEASNGPQKVRPRSNTSLLLRSNTSGEPNVSNTTTADTFAGGADSVNTGVNGMPGVVALSSGSFSTGTGSIACTPTPVPPAGTLLIGSFFPCGAQHP